MKFFNIFKKQEKLSELEIEQEKLRVRIKRERKFILDLNKKKINLKKRIYRSLSYYSGIYCKNREKSLSKHNVYLELQLAQNPAFKDHVTEIQIHCNFCEGLISEVGEVENIFFYDEVCDLDITTKDLKDWGF